jgi:type IV secretory system conjugative DNA transfer VirD4/TraG family protein
MASQLIEVDANAHDRGRQHGGLPRRGKAIANGPAAHEFGGGQAMQRGGLVQFGAFRRRQADAKRSAAPLVLHLLRSRHAVPPRLPWALGELKVVADAAGQLAGMGVKLWPIIQNLTQLRQYGDNWEVFLANAGQQQVFAMNDQTTARYFSERLGHHISWRKVRSRDGANRVSFEWVPQSPTWLRTGPELARESSKDSGKALIFSEGGDVSLVRRGAYDRLFTPDEYAPNPYQPPPRVLSFAGLYARLDKWERKSKNFEWAWQRRMFAKMDAPSQSTSAEASEDEASPFAEASGDGSGERSEDRSARVVHLRPSADGKLRRDNPPSQGLRRDEERERAEKKPDA